MSAADRVNHSRQISSIGASNQTTLRRIRSQIDRKVLGKCVESMSAPVHTVNKSEKGGNKLNP